LFDECSESFAHQKIEDWYMRSPEDVCDNGGKNLIEEHYNNSIVEAVKTIYPEYYWKPWMFKFANDDVWRDLDNQKNFFDELATKLNIRNWRDWYEHSENDIIRFGGGGILSHHNQSLMSTLSALYPNHPWELPFAKRSYWINNEEAQRKFMDFVAKELNVKTWEDWYTVTFKEIEYCGGSTLLYIYNDSPMKLIRTIYSEHPWQFWKFSKVPNGTWEDLGNLTEFIEWAGKQLGVKQLDDWYGISSTQLGSLGFGGVLDKYGSISHVLAKVYPFHSWDFTKGISKKTKTQNLLFITLKELLPNVQDFFLEYPHPSLIYSSKKNVELDIFIPSLNLAFEYHGQQHYSSIEGTEFVNTPFEDRKSNDDERRNLCKEAGITLIEVPYWWDKTKESLLATLNKYRPDLFPATSSAPPIPNFKLNDHTKSDGKVTATLNPLLSSANTWK